MAGASFAGMDDRGRHLDKSTFALSKIPAPEDTGGVQETCDGVVGGDVDLLGFKDGKDVVTVDAGGCLWYPSVYNCPNRPPGV
jgi:hypothetical protein